MFLESLANSPTQKGSIEVICGPMFSGKTEELIRRIKRAKYAKLNIKIFKPKIDTRYNKDNVVSHDNNFIEAIVVENSNEILSLIEDARVVAIDEAQFFDDNLFIICNQIADNGIRVIVAGLDMDFLGKPFGPIPQLLAVAEYITKVHAICINCGSIANHSFRKTQDTELVKIGENNEYKPLCRTCFSNQKY
ncbi:MAG: thymidine kinase [Flavobacteriales bacterium]|nr:thymidine kinase [Flavobacteriales bacterium]